MENDIVADKVWLASQYRYRDDLFDSDPFVFGFDTDNDDVPVLGKGDDLTSLIIGFSTKTLIKSLDQELEYMLHLDATFKLNKRGFPLIVIVHFLH